MSVALYGIDKELDDYFAVIGEALHGEFDSHVVYYYTNRTNVSRENLG